MYHFSHLIEIKMFPHSLWTMDKASCTCKVIMWKHMSIFNYWKSRERRTRYQKNCIYSSLSLMLTLFEHLLKRCLKRPQLLVILIIDFIQPYTTQDLLGQFFGFVTLAFNNRKHILTWQVHQISWKSRRNWNRTWSTY